MPRPPELTPEARAAALEKATRARRTRAEAKEKLKMGALNLRELLDQIGGEGEEARAREPQGAECARVDAGAREGARPASGGGAEDQPGAQAPGPRPQSAQRTSRVLRTGLSRRGILLVLSGPSGTGKGTVGRRIRDLEPEMRWSVSWATRPPRPGEVEGVDYHFVEREDFERARDEGGFLEWFEVFGDLKGTPARPVLEHLAAGDDVLLEVDVQGALAVREACPEALLVFLRPPSREVQRERIVGRAQDSPEAVERRLAEAEAEEAKAGLFDAVIVNDDLETAVGEVAAILRARRESDRPSA